jgi:uncharacterized ParB-like nuclease family protein
MRNRFLMKGAVAALCAVVLGLVGCDNGSEDQPAAVKGTVRVIMEDGQAGETDARTAVPASPGFAYTLTFTAGGKTPVNVTLDGNAGEVELEAGTWTLTARGSKDGTNVAEGGPVTVNVSSDEGAVSVSVPIRPVLNGADGTFRYNISAAEGLTVVSARLTALNIGEFGELTTNLSIAGGLQTESLMPGYYWLEVTVRRDSQTLIRREAVHIYTGATTMKSYNLIEEDFYVLRLEEVEVYLANVQGGGTADKPVPLVVDANLGNGGWGTLRSTINDAGKYVALDISACVMVGTEFDPGTDEAGKGYITALVLPDEAKSIVAGTYDDPTFRYFTRLKSVSGAGVETVGEAAFSGTALTSVSLPAATSIGEDAFYNCTALTSVSLPAAETIGDYAFQSCTALESVDMPAAETIGDYAFQSCTALESVDMPASLTTISSNPFIGCTNLSSITVDSANTAFSARDGMLLDKAGTTLIAYPSATGSITLTVTSIGDYAFRNCTALESVSLPLVQTIPAGSYSNSTYYGVFSGCTALKAIDLPAVTSIGDYAFAGTNLESVSLPAVTDIGAYAFRDCAALESVSLPLVQTIPAGSAVYSSGTYTYIYYGVFSGCTALKAIDLPAATSIGDYAFRKCTALTSVSVPVATSIGERAFYNCDALESVSLPAATDIGGYAFYGTALTSVSLPVATSIGGGAFYGTRLTSVSLPSATSIGNSAFDGCTRLTSVSLPAAETIGGLAFDGCTALTLVSLPLATSIGYSAFHNCAALTLVSLPATPPSIGGSIFSYTSSTSTITIRVPTGAVPAYTSAWGVNASTPARSGNTSDVYGFDHKAVRISE